MPALFDRAQIPNLLTCLRLALAAAFFGVLSRYQFPEGPSWLLYWATGLFVVAAVTDAFDGFLARRWNAVSAFGRIMDPFADKILVLGAFVMLASPAFMLVEGWSQLGMAGRSPKLLAKQISGVESWMVIVILARELLVTTIRAVMEGRGIDFSASFSGKAKMIVQSIGVPTILVLCAWLERPAMLHLSSSTVDVVRPGESLAAKANVIIAWTVTAVTIWSALPYILRAMLSLRPPSEPRKEHA